MKLVRTFGANGHIGVSALEDGHIVVAIWGHNALEIGARDGWRVGDDGWFESRTLPSRLGVVMAQANAMADEAMRMANEAAGAVAALPEVKA